MASCSFNDVPSMKLEPLLGGILSSIHCKIYATTAALMIESANGRVCPRLRITCIHVQLGSREVKYGFMLIQCMDSHTKLYALIYVGRGV